MRLLSLSFGFVLGAIGVASYVVIACLRRKVPVLGEAAVVFMSFPGIIGGIGVFLRTIDEENNHADSDERTYLALAGITMIWVSVSALVKTYNALKPGEFRTGSAAKG